MVLGHNHPAIRDAVIEAAQRGLSFGAPTEMEVKMAQLVTELVPTMDMVRMVNSGTEATMSAIRGARLHQPRQNHQVRRLLPRPRRLPAGESRFRRADPRPAELTGRAGRLRQAHPDLYL